MTYPFGDKEILQLFAKYDQIRDLNLETCEGFRQYFRDNPYSLFHAIETTGPIGLAEALHMLVSCDESRDAVRRTMSIITPPDSDYGEAGQPPDTDPLF